MKQSGKIKQTLAYAFLLLTLLFMMLGCNVKLEDRQKTEDEKQMEFFKEQLKLRQYYFNQNK